MAKNSLSSNPVASHNKAIKQKAIKRAKQVQQAARDDRLATQKTAPLERRVADLSRRKDDGDLKPTELEMLTKLERQLGMIKKAKKRKGVDDDGDDGGHQDDTRNSEQRSKTQQAGSRYRDNDRPDRTSSAPEKRQRTEFDSSTRSGRSNPNLEPMTNRRFGHEPDSSDTDSDVGDIPMPGDVENMPPIPRRRNDVPAFGSSANTATGPAGSRIGPALPPAPPAQAVYESKASVRDLKKEATVFVPAVVKAKLKAAAASTTTTTTTADTQSGAPVSTQGERET